ncbi:hypothetical protein BDQ17DRAFT_1330334 [Cyathus striatus]|nr:hypothetical protein BDQ17DRAFT_1330334 [Cyathus striatus]
MSASRPCLLASFRTISCMCIADVETHMADVDFRCVNPLKSGYVPLARAVEATGSESLGGDDQGLFTAKGVEMGHLGQSRVRHAVSMQGEMAIDREEWKLAGKQRVTKEGMTAPAGRNA